MLEKIQNIEGLDAFTQIESMNDTDPGAMQVTFRVEAEEMPFLTQQEGKRVTKNFVRIRQVINLGNLINDRRIRDEVEFDEAKGKWVIKKLYPVQQESDILNFSEQWNAFARGCSAVAVGTPLITLFKHDPSKVDRYKANYIETIEQLAAVTDANIDSLFMGAKADREQAQFFIRRLQEQAPALQINNRFEEMERAAALKDQTIADLKAKLDEVLKSQIEALEGKKEKAKPGRKAKEAPLPTNIEGL